MADDQAFGANDLSLTNRTLGIMNKKPWHTKTWEPFEKLPGVEVWLDVRHVLAVLGFEAGILVSTFTAPEPQLRFGIVEHSQHPDDRSLLVARESLWDLVREGSEDWAAALAEWKTR